MRSTGTSHSHTCRNSRAACPRRWRRRPKWPSMRSLRQSRFRASRHTRIRNQPSRVTRPTPTQEEPPLADAPKTPQDVAAICDERDVRFIRLWFTDILGQLKSFSINRDELDDAFEGGMGFDGSSITGFNPIEESDMIAMPDPSTFNILPW